MNSIWLEHPSYPGYRVSPEGQVLSLIAPSRKALVLKPRLNRDGYPVVSLYRKGVFVHRLVADIFVQKPKNEKQLQVNHKNGTKTDNRSENLEWVTAQENQIHSRHILKNRCAVGELSGSVKLTEKQVLEIRERIKNGRRGIMTQVAKEFGISVSNVHAIKTGRSWNYKGVL